MNMKKVFLNSFFLILSLVAFVSCDKDFNSIGSDIIGNENYEFSVYNVNNIKAYSKETSFVQTNNLPLNSFGIYNNPFFGSTKASFVTQVELLNTNFVVGDMPVIDSVYIYIPYFSTVKTTDSDSNRTFDLDSVYGYDETAKFKLQVYENNYVLNTLDPNPSSGVPFSSTQKYYNNKKPDISAVKGELLNTGAITQNDEFIISNKEIYIYKTDGAGVFVDAAGVALADQNDVSLRIVKERKSPGVWLDLKKSYFQTKILDQAANGILFNSNVFKNHFKGLFFDVEELVAGQGSLAMLDFSRAEFKILFKSSINGGDASRIVLNLRIGATGGRTANNINFLEYTNSSAYSNGLTSSSEAFGDEKLYLKGGQGSVAYIDLFGADGPDANDVPDELDELRTKNWLINQATLTMFIDQASMVNSPEPQRIYIFDATNNRPIIDYILDPSTSTKSKFNKFNFNGIISKETTGKGIKYKFSISSYISSLLNGNTDTPLTNVRIGVAVTENINISLFANINPNDVVTVGGNQIKLVPLSSVMSPQGTVLYGRNSSVPLEKRLKLEIFYTEPK
jgi:hypothetical protein